MFAGVNVITTVFGEFRMFMAKKLAFFLKKNNAMIQIIQKKQYFEQKRLFFRKFFWRK
jgi:hypothetical protein